MKKKQEQTKLDEEMLKIEMEKIHDNFCYLFGLFPYDYYEGFEPDTEIS